MLFVLFEDKCEQSANERSGAKAKTFSSAVEGGLNAPSGIG